MHLRLTSLLAGMVLSTAAFAQIVGGVSGQYEMDALANVGDVVDSEGLTGGMPANAAVSASVADVAFGVAVLQSSHVGEWLEASIDASATTGFEDSPFAHAGGLAYFEFELAGSTDLRLLSEISEIDNEDEWAIVVLAKLEQGNWIDLHVHSFNGFQNNTFSDLEGGMYRLYVGAQTFALGEGLQTASASASLQAVPEPASAAALALGALALLRRKLKERA